MPQKQKSKADKTLLLKSVNGGQSGFPLSIRALLRFHVAPPLRAAPSSPSFVWPLILLIKKHMLAEYKCSNHAYLRALYHALMHNNLFSVQSRWRWPPHILLFSLAFQARGQVGLELSSLSFFFSFLFLEVCACSCQHRSVFVHVRAHVTLLPVWTLSLNFTASPLPPPPNTLMRSRYYNWTSVHVNA